jgi:hypothetical protein
MDDREFWVEVRRWLKNQSQANANLIRAIERKYNLAQDTQEKTAADRR